MTTLQLTELGDAIEVPLAAERGLALARSGVVNSTPSFTAGNWLIGAGTYVGVAEVAGIELWIKPKVDIDRLLFLLGYALSPKGWRDEEISLQAKEDLLPAIARAFERQTDRALQRGLLQGYLRVEESLPVLRGRMRESDQLRRRFGLAVPLEVAYDEFTANIAENRILLGAARRLLRLQRVPDDVRRRLVRLTTKLIDITEPTPGVVPGWIPTRLNARYHTALHLGELILRATSVEQTHGGVRFSGFMFNMAVVFEDFVTVALSEALQARGGAARRQDRAHRLDLAGKVQIRPDLVWYSDEGAPIAVVDAKYKAERPSGFPDADLYQMLAYCTALGLDRGHLVYAKGNEAATSHAIRNADVEIVQHAVDLAESPPSLLAQIELIADEVAANRVQVA